jgi:PIN domain
MTKILYLFPDTNLLIQCLPLEQLDWERWKEFDEIDLVVSRPVQKEIDKHKNGSNERLAKRGRKAANLLRDVITGSTDHKVIREAEPRVRLFVRTEIKSSETLADILDYSEPDDQLVGTVHSFMAQNPGNDARVLTHDSGPMASAKMAGVAVVVIPDEWLLPPEKTESDKRIKSLEAEVARLKEAEPAFDITCLDVTGAESDNLEREATRYDAMSASEIVSLMVRLKERFPIATEFGPRERSERKADKGPLSMLLQVKEVFTPATENEIKEYRERHASWLKTCEEMLRSLHTALQEIERPSFFGFRVSNDGARPATDVLVTIAAKGQLAIMPPPYRRDEALMSESRDRADYRRIRHSRRRGRF